MSPNGSEVMWATPSGSPRATRASDSSIYPAGTSAPRQAGRQLAVRRARQPAGPWRRLFYIASAASRDFSTVVFYTTDCFEIGLGFCDHTFVRVTRSGEQEVLADPVSRNSPRSAFPMTASGSITSIRGQISWSRIRRGDRTDILPTPACGLRSSLDALQQRLSRIALPGLRAEQRPQRTV